MDPIVDAGEYFSGPDGSSEEERKVHARRVLCAQGSSTSHKMSSNGRGFNLDGIFLGGHPPSPKKRVKKGTTNLGALGETMSSFIKTGLYRVLCIHNAQNPHAEDAATFVETMRKHALGFYATMRGEILPKVGDDTTHPLVTFYDKMKIYEELHVEPAKKPPAVTKDQRVHDVWTGEVYDMFNPLTKGDTKRRKTNTSLLTLVPGGDGVPFSVVCDEEGARFLIMCHTIAHFEKYVLLAIKERGSLSGRSFEAAWETLTGKHRNRPVTKWAQNSSTPFVKTTVRLYRTLALSFTLMDKGV